jgi:hypothetical protein
MRILDFEQGSYEWHKARAVIPTASNFSKILTSTGKKSDQADGYANQIIASMLLGRSADTFKGNDSTRNGSEQEIHAVKYYEFQKDIETTKVGLVINDKGTYGASPDRLVGEKGILEIKSPDPKTHIEYILNQEIALKYKPQTQGQILVLQREWVDTCSYHPEIKPVITPVGRDEAYISILDEALEEFNNTLQRKILRMIELGYTQLEEYYVSK